MKKKEEAAFNDGRAAYAEHGDLAIGLYGRRGPEMRVFFRNGVEHERRERLARQITPEQREESEAAAGSLRDWLDQQRNASQP